MPFVAHRLAALAAILALLISLAGCRSGGETVLRVAGWGAAGDDSEYVRLEEEIFREFERLNPGVRIQQENTPGSQEYVRKILLSFVARAEPDVLRLDASSAAVFINNGVLLDLAAHDPRFDWGQFFPNVVDIARRGEAVYAVPVDFTPMVMYFNRSLFREAGVAEPEPGWTWEDFLAKAKALTTKDQYGFTFSNWMPGWITWVWSNGGDVLDAQGSPKADPRAAEALGFLRDLVNEHQVAPSLSQMAAEGASLFPNRRAAMEISGHWNLVGLASAPKVRPEDIGVAPLPVARRGMAPVTVLYESGWAIGRSSPRKELAWKFIQFYTSAASQRKLQRTGIGVCARKDVAQERAATPLSRTFLSIIPSGRMPWGAQVEDYAFVEAEGQKMMDGILKSGREPQKALREFAEKVRRSREEL